MIHFIIVQNHLIYLKQKILSRTTINTNIVHRSGIYVYYLLTARSEKNDLIFTHKM